MARECGNAYAARKQCKMRLRQSIEQLACKVWKAVGAQAKRRDGAAWAMWSGLACSEWCYARAVAMASHKWRWRGAATAVTRRRGSAGGAEDARAAWRGGAARAHSGGVERRRRTVLEAWIGGAGEADRMAAAS